MAGKKFCPVGKTAGGGKNATVVLLGTSDEKPIGRKIIESVERSVPASSEKVIDLMGKTSLDDLALVLRKLDALATGDTGTMHLASAMKTRILALFMGPAWCHETGPYGNGHLVLQASPDCAPCREGSDCPYGRRCRDLITPDLAFDALAALVDNDGGSLDLKVSDEVRLYRSVLDGFGVAYTPVDRRAMDLEEVIALSWREAGRGLIRPEYKPELPFELIDPLKFTGKPNELSRRADMLKRVETELKNGNGLTPPTARQDQLLAKILAWLASSVSGDRVPRFIRDMNAVITAAQGSDSAGTKELSKIAEKYYNDAVV